MMNIMMKGAALVSLAIAAVTATAPAQAQYQGGWRGNGDYRSDHRRWDNDRRWDDRRHWRGDRRDWRGDRGYRGHRQRCWTQWRYDRYRDRDVRVRICR